MQRQNTDNFLLVKYEKGTKLILDDTRTYPFASNFRAIASDIEALYQVAEGVFGELARVKTILGGRLK